MCSTMKPISPLSAVLQPKYGEWLYYDGQEIVLGSSQGGKEMDFLIDGNQSFDMSISLMPAKIQYDWV